jgi:hypothetical protein
VVKRTDIPNSRSKKAKTLIVADNRTADHHEYDYEILQADYEPEVLGEYFYEGELGIPDVDFKSFDETIADTVQYTTCPHCGKEFPK